MRVRVEENPFAAVNEAAMVAVGRSSAVAAWGRLAVASVRESQAGQSWPGCRSLERSS